MKFRNVLAATAALTLAAAPAVAEASYERVAAQVEGESELSGGSGVIIGILAAAAIIAGIIIAVDSNDDDDLPTSP